MLQLLNLSNIALIDELKVEFEPGLNLLTGETGSGKSIIVDALGLLIGGRYTSELLKTGAERGFIEGLFSVVHNPHVVRLLAGAGVFVEDDEEPFSSHGKSGGKSPETQHQLIIRRELSASGRNKIFINNRLASHSLLRDLRPYLVDIHGQGDQQTLFNPETHLELLDAFAGLSTGSGLCETVINAFEALSKLQHLLESLKQDESVKFQLLDTLKYQIQELEYAQLAIGEDENLEVERRRLINVEKLTALSQASYGRLYEDDDAALARVRQTIKDLAELGEFDPTFRGYQEGLESASAVLEDLAFSLRNFSDKLEFSSGRLAEIEDRLAEISRLKRKYGGSIEAALEHLARSQDRLRTIETSDERETELKRQLAQANSEYWRRAEELHVNRVRAARKFEKAVEQGLAQVAMDNARFEVRIITAGQHETAQESTNRRSGLNSISERGIDHVEFYFSSNVGEELKPLARVASGGEASRLMLTLKTVANASEFPRTIVFDEIDAGIGGRVSEAVGEKLRQLSETNQVLCVTHQPQIARFADNHLVVKKDVMKGRTRVSVAKLDRKSRIEELARMLTGAEITDSARKHAREMLKN